MRVKYLDGNGAFWEAELIGPHPTLPDFVLARNAEGTLLCLGIGRVEAVTEEGCVPLRQIWSSGPNRDGNVKQQEQQKEKGKSDE